MSDAQPTLLERLRGAAEAAPRIGLVAEADAAEEVASRIAERGGFAGDAYVMAFAGGTGVGKSSVLNALAGHTVSTVRAIRPTTDEPIAWVADQRRDELAPLLAWLEVRHSAGHADEDLAGVAILDLPDVDSVRREHRARVDELLPRIDAVTWIVDPEKYDDERLHGYLRSLASHAARMRFVVNKADRLTDSQRRTLADDLRRRLADDGISGAPIHVVSATTGQGIDDLRAGLASAADAKALIAAKLATDARDALDAVASAAGLSPDADYAPLLGVERLARAVDEAARGALAVVDPVGLARQVRAAVMARARRHGGSLLGRAVGLLIWMTGGQRRTGDPAAYLLGWRSRGTLGRALNPVRSALVEAAAAVPPRVRPALLDALGADLVEDAVAAAMDAATREAAHDLRIRGSIAWPLVGVLQLAVGAIFLFAVAWYVTLFVSGGQVPVATVEAPVLGPVPMPLILLAGSIVVSALLGWLLAAHARIIGGRLARRVEQRTRAAVQRAVTDVGFAGLARVEAARADIASAARRPA